VRHGGEEVDLLPARVRVPLHELDLSLGRLGDVRVRAEPVVVLRLQLGAARLILPVRYWLRTFAFSAVMVSGIPIKSPGARTGAEFEWRQIGRDMEEIANAVQGADHGWRVSQVAFDDSTGEAGKIGSWTRGPHKRRYGKAACRQGMRHGGPDKAGTARHQYRIAIEARPDVRRRDIGIIGPFSAFMAKGCCHFRPYHFR